MAPRATAYTGSRSPVAIGAGPTLMLGRQNAKAPEFLAEGAVQRLQLVEHLPRAIRVQPFERERWPRTRTGNVPTQASMPSRSCAANRTRNAPPRRSARIHRVHREAFRHRGRRLRGRRALQCQRLSPCMWPDCGTTTSVRRSPRSVAAISTAAMTSDSTHGRAFIARRGPRNEPASQLACTPSRQALAL